MTPKAEKIKERYLMGYVTDEQLLRYFQLGVLTQAEYDEIYALKHGEV